MSEEQGTVEQAFGSDSEMDSFFASGGENVPEDSSVSEDSGTEGTEQPAGEQQGSETEPAETNDSQEEKPNSDSELDEGERARQETAEEKRFRAMADSERIKRKEIQRELEENRKELDRLRQSLEQVFTKATNKEEQAPDFEEDPIGALKYKSEQLEKKLSEVDKFSEETKEQQRQREIETQFENEFRRQAYEFSKSKADFGDAYQFAIQARFDEYKAMGLSDEESFHKMRADEKFIVAKAMQDERNPAEAIYNFAKIRGYSGAKKEVPQNAGNKIDAIEKGAKIGRSISNASANPNESYRLEDIGNMSDDDFAKIDWNKHVLRHG